MASHRFWRGISLLLLAFCAPTSGWSQPNAQSTLEIPQTLEQANAQRERAAAMKQVAEDQFMADQAACYKKVLVSGCLKDAQARHRAALVEARNIDVPARAVQRDAKRSDVETGEAKREADKPKREADMKEQAANFRSEEARKAAERERKIAERAEQTAKYREKSAAETKARQERQAQREKRDADRAASKANQDKQAETSAQARVPKP